MNHLDIRKSIALGVLCAFLVNTFGPAPLVQAQDFRLPAPGVMVHLTPEFTPAHLKGIIIHPENVLKFDFIVYKGDQIFSEQEKQVEYTKLIKYFLAALAVPDDDQWVNLSPYEKDRIIKEDFGKTQMGRDLLAQDYMLKQITASLIYPQDKLGQKFWNKVYAKAYQQFGTTNIPINTFNKVWIVPDNAEVFEKGNMAYVLKNRLKVMLEEDYLSLNKHNGIEVTGTREQNKAHAIGSQIVREVVLPALEQEINEGKNFAPLRQVFSGVVLAAWYKRELKESFLAKIYMDRSRLKGIDQDPENNQIIYQQYLKAFKKGVFNFVKEDLDKYSNENIPRKYFSGGMATKYDAATLAIVSPTAARLAAAAGDFPREELVTVQNNVIGHRGLGTVEEVRVPKVAQSIEAVTPFDHDQLQGGRRKIFVRNANAEFSWRTRRGLIRQARSHGEIYDVFVAGGGIAGTSVARDSVIRGLSTLVVEQSDWGSGTSGTSTKMIHGGIRYLELSLRNIKAMFRSLMTLHWGDAVKSAREAFINFRFVQESLKEQKIMVNNSLPITKLQRLHFIISPDDPRSGFTVYLGAMLYYFMGGRETPAPKLYTGNELHREFPELGANQAKAVVTFYEFATDDSLLTLYTAKSAFQHGADTLSYVQVRKVERSAQGHYVITLRDTIHGEEFQVRAKTVVNAAGPYIDELHQVVKIREGEVSGGSSLAKPRKLLRLVVGAHFAVPAIGSLKKSVIVTVPSATSESNRKQLMVVYRQEGGLSYFLVDTRDWESGLVIDQGRVRKEIQYMIDTLNRLFPGANLAQDSIMRTDWGIKPLAALDVDDPDAIPREHKIVQDGHYYVLTGVKLIDGRRAAQELVDRIAKDFPDAGKCRTANNNLGIPENPYSRSLKEVVRTEMVVRLSDLVLRRSGIKLFMELYQKRENHPEFFIPVVEKIWRRAMAKDVGAQLGWETEEVGDPSWPESRTDEESRLLRSDMSLGLRSRNPGWIDDYPIFHGYSTDYGFSIIRIPETNIDNARAITGRIQEAFIKLLMENRTLFAEHKTRVAAMDRLENGIIKFSLKDFNGKPKALLLFRIFKEHQVTSDGLISLGVSVLRSDVAEGTSPILSDEPFSPYKEFGEIQFIAVKEIKKLLGQAMGEDKDGAMVVKRNEGGIDFNSANFNLKIKRDGNGVSLPVVQQDMDQLNNLEGLEPVILQIQPASESALLFKLVQPQV